MQEDFVPRTCSCGNQISPDGHCLACETECYECNEWTDDDEIVLGPDRNNRCEQCHRSIYHACSDCGVQCLTENGSHCNACDDNYELCDNCGAEHRPDSYLACTHEEEYYCSISCFDAARPYCSECDARHPDGVCTAKSPKLPKSTDYEPSYLPNRAFAVELETDRTVACPPGWEAVSDGSIGGKEYLSGPVLGGAAVRKIEYGCPKLSDMSYNEGVNVSEATGYHIHMNARDMTEDQIARFARFCVEYQKDFFMMVPPSRSKESGYSRPLPAVYKYVNGTNLDTTIYEMDSDDDDDREMESCKNNKYHGSRYYWANFHSYYFRKTIEIRLHSGTTLAEKVLRWAEMWLKLFEFITSTDKDFKCSETDIWTIMQAAGLRDCTIAFYRSRIEHFAGREERKRLKKEKDREAYEARQALYHQEFEAAQQMVEAAEREQVRNVEVAPVESLQEIPSFARFRDLSAALSRAHQYIYTFEPQDESYFGSL